jgi:hypothetical protein
VDEDDVVNAWISLPRRIYLDTSTLQTVYDYGEVIWEGEAFEPIGRAAKVEGLAEELDALRMIFLVNQRAMFEFVVTQASLGQGCIGLLGLVGVLKDGDQEALGVGRTADDAVLDVGEPGASIARTCSTLRSSTFSSSRSRHRAEPRPGIAQIHRPARRPDTAGRHWRLLRAVHPGRRRAGAPRFGRGRRRTRPMTSPVEPEPAHRLFSALRLGGTAMLAR